MKTSETNSSLKPFISEFIESCKGINPESVRTHVFNFGERLIEQKPEHFSGERLALEKEKDLRFFHCNHSVKDFFVIELNEAVKKKLIEKYVLEVFIDFVTGYSILANLPQNVHVQPSQKNKPS